jgi:nucleobase:cation symporter-1, NCS1 family
VIISVAGSVTSVIIPKLLLDTGAADVDATWIGNYSRFLDCAAWDS